MAGEQNQCFTGIYGTVTHRNNCPLSTNLIHFHSDFLNHSKAKHCQHCRAEHSIYCGTAPPCGCTLYNLVVATIETISCVMILSSYHYRKTVCVLEFSIQIDKEMTLFLFLQQDDSFKNYSVIGLLDIYGFEVFQNNRYSINDMKHEHLRYSNLPIVCFQHVFIHLNLNITENTKKQLFFFNHARGPPLGAFCCVSLPSSLAAGVCSVGCWAAKVKSNTEMQLKAPEIPCKWNLCPEFCKTLF